MESSAFIKTMLEDGDSPIAKLAGSIKETRKAASLPLSVVRVGLWCLSVLTFVFLVAALVVRGTGVISLRYLCMLVPFFLLALAGLLIYYHQAKQSAALLKDALDLMLELQREALKMDKTIDWDNLGTQIETFGELREKFKS